MDRCIDEEQIPGSYWPSWDLIALSQYNCEGIPKNKFIHLKSFFPKANYELIRKPKT